MDHLFQDMDWDASLACDSPLRSSSFYVGRVRDPVVEQSTAEHFHIHCLRQFLVGASTHSGLSSW